MKWLHQRIRRKRRRDPSVRIANDPHLELRLASTLLHLVLIGSPLLILDQHRLKFVQAKRRAITTSRFPLPVNHFDHFLLKTPHLETARFSLLAERDLSKKVKHDLRPLSNVQSLDQYLPKSLIPTYRPALQRSKTTNRYFLRRNLCVVVVERGTYKPLLPNLPLLYDFPLLLLPPIPTPTRNSLNSTLRTFLSLRDEKFRLNHQQQNLRRMITLGEGRGCQRKRRR